MAKGDRRARKGPAPDAPAPIKGVSDVDAMGKDKRREVIGHSYGPSRRSQIMFFVVVAAVLAVVFGGYALAISQFDQPAGTYPDKAAWSNNQIPTRSPADPCGEPGNPYPSPTNTPCSAAYKKANAPVVSDSAELGSLKSGNGK